MNFEAYLSRIGVERPEKPTLEALKALTRAHLKTVPFENLEVIDECREPSLEADALFDKVVVRKRGGYCFELNKLFYLLLCELGFDCHYLGVRIIHRRPEPCAVSHRGTIVCIDGKRYYADVGFGGAGPKGVICLDTEEEQIIAGERFVVHPDKDTDVIYTMEEGFVEPVLRIKDQNAWEDMDFVTLSRYYATYHGSPFKNKRVMHLSREDGWISLTDKVFVIKQNGVKTEKVLESEAEIIAVIEQQFGLEFPGNKNVIQ